MADFALDTPEPVYTLTVTATQLEAIRDATEVMARVNIGQLDSVATLLLHLPTEAFCEVRDGLSTLNCRSDEIRDPTMQDLHLTAWGVYHAARYRLYLDDCAELGLEPDPTRTFGRPPVQRNAQPIPEVVRVR